MSGEHNNISDNFQPYIDKKSTLKEQDIEKDHRNLVDKSLDTGRYIRDNLSKHIY